MKLEKFHTRHKRHSHLNNIIKQNNLFKQRNRRQLYFIVIIINMTDVFFWKRDTTFISFLFYRWHTRNHQFNNGLMKKQCEIKDLTRDMFTTFFSLKTNRLEIRFSHRFTTS